MKLLMNSAGFSRMSLQLLGAAMGLMALSSSALAVPFVDQAENNQNDHYIGVGMRGGLNDTQVFVLDSKFEVLQLEDSSLAVRPALLFGDYFEARIPVTYALPLGDELAVFGGGGFAYNCDDTGHFDPMLTAGVDVKITDQLTLNVEGSYIFQPHDQDAELTTSINWRF